MVAKILIGGDIVPTESNKKLFSSGNVDELIGAELKNILKCADFTIFNLEVPLTDRLSPIQKCGPNLIASTDTINGLKVINPYFFTLANNHILDQGEQGLITTEQILDDASIEHSGTGKNLVEASQGYIKDVNGIKIGIYCCAEHEFSIATENSPGANPFDPLESFDHITRLKASSDYVIVLYHGGKEHYRYPSPYLQKVCRKCVDKGADLVVCQHSHCIGCEEKWNDGIIVYGQGNFLFDRSDSEFWKTGLLIQVNIEVTEKNRKPSNNSNTNKNMIAYIPVVKIDNKVRIATKDKADTILSYFWSRSEKIKENGFIETNYKKFADEMKWDYLSSFAGKSTRGFFYRGLNKLSRYAFMKVFLSRRYGKKERLALTNFCACEAHRELLLRGLN